MVSVSRCPLPPAGTCGTPGNRTVSVGRSPAPSSPTTSSGLSVRCRSAPTSGSTSGVITTASRFRDMSVNVSLTIDI